MPPGSFPWNGRLRLYRVGLTQNMAENAVPVREVRRSWNRRTRKGSAHGAMTEPRQDVMGFYSPRTPA